MLIYLRIVLVLKLILNTYGVPGIFWSGYFSTNIESLKVDVA